LWTLAREVVMIERFAGRELVRVRQLVWGKAGGLHPANPTGLR